MADIKDLKEYAEVNNVPIMQEDGIDFLTTFIIKKQIKNVLEIGTAIGYSAIMMARADKDNLGIDGYIITDNMYFHGYVEMEESEIPSKNIQGIVRKIKDYTYFLENHMLYKTTIYDIGDGIAVTERRG